MSCLGVGLVFPPDSCGPSWRVALQEPLGEMVACSPTVVAEIPQAIKRPGHGWAQKQTHDKSAVRMCID